MMLSLDHCTKTPGGMFRLCQFGRGCVIHLSGYPLLLTRDLLL